MYVQPAYRRTGVGRAVLTALEARARALGYARLRLETGVRQPEAIALYRAAGYEPIEPYGLYRDEPMSRCFEKRIA
jgi:GNAT superfamily N-acetyltransferase